MSPQERLAAALQSLGLPLPMLTTTAILAADRTLAQDIADGQALRMLREALLDRYPSQGISVRAGIQSDGVAFVDWWADHADLGSDARGDTIAEAADACRKALEDRR